MWKFRSHHVTQKAATTRSTLRRTHYLLYAPFSMDPKTPNVTVV